MAAINDKRLLFVTGKGGVGKSTVAAALGLAAARAGKRTILAEVAGQDRVSRVFREKGVKPSEETLLAESLWAISIDPEPTVKEYLEDQLPVKAVADLLASSRVFQYFAAATPGLAELLTMGKIWELAQLERRDRKKSPYDLVIVDAPATGHGVAIMRAPKTFADVARVGPIAHQGEVIHATIIDRSFTGIVAAALPEEMPVNETQTLREQLDKALGLDIDLVVANGVYPDRFADGDVQAVRSALESVNGNEPGRTALRAALTTHGRAVTQREQLERLAEVAGSAPVQLPFLFEPAIGLPELERLSRELEGVV